MTDEEPSPAIRTARGSALEEHDDRDWAKKFGVNDAQLRKAVEKVGNQASIVEKELRAPYHPVWRRVIVFIRRSPNSNWRQAALVQEANPARPHDAKVAGRRIARSDLEGTTWLQKSTDSPKHVAFPSSHEQR
jgi:hypothetical protein